MTSTLQERDTDGIYSPSPNDEDVHDTKLLESWIRGKICQAFLAFVLGITSNINGWVDVPHRE